MWMTQKKVGTMEMLLQHQFLKNTKSILLKNKEYQNINSIKISQNDSMDSVQTRQSSLLKIAKDSMPSLIGLDKRTAIEILERLGMDFEIKGFGLVKKQSPMMGTKINQETTVVLEFQAPRYE
jgi:beta-lactam-binding protein with PASTA domain